jgi:hypothetical protein
MSFYGVERRKVPRYPYLHTVYFFEEARFHEEACLGASVDLSDAGMSLYTSVPLGESQNVMIKNALQEGYRKATVRWSKRYSSDLYKVGLMFGA